MDAMIKITVPESFRKELQKKGNEVARNIAISARDALTQEYQIMVETFYGSYSPQKYKRHFTLYNSGKPYYRNSHGTRFHGGVEISPSGISDVHHDSPADVLQSAIEGFHGRPSMGIFTSPAIIDHMIQYRDLIFSNIASFAGLSAIHI